MFPVRLSGQERLGATVSSGWGYELATLPEWSKRTSSNPRKTLWSWLNPACTPNSLNSVTDFALQTISSACCTRLQCFSAMKLPGGSTRLSLWGETGLGHPRSVQLWWGCWSPAWALISHWRKVGVVLPWPGGRGSAFSGQRVAAPYPPNAVCLGRCGTGVRELCVWGGGLLLWLHPPCSRIFSVVSYLWIV